ncbi:hypothetical protein KY289_035985 [Solanum tuberosum]|nr:hypothetical protein KY289_035985 [Solanum tuberosum]
MEEDQWQTQKKKNFRGYPQNNQRNHQNNQQNQVYKPVPHQNQTSKEPQKDNQSKDANNKQGIDSMLPTPQPHGSVLSPFLVLPIKYFITSKARMPIISKVLIQCSINPTPLIIVLFYLDLSSEKSGGVKVGMQEKITNLLEGNQKGVVNINNKINMTTQNDTQNLSPVLIEDIDHAAEDSLDYESMEGPELGHSDDEGEVNSGRVEAATQTMSQVQQQQNIT